jgi:hypothetical protein
LEDWIEDQGDWADRCVPPAGPAEPVSDGRLSGWRGHPWPLIEASVMGHGAARR